MLVLKAAFFTGGENCLISCDIKLKLCARLSSHGSMIETELEGLVLPHHAWEKMCFSSAAAWFDAELEDSNHMVLEPEGGCKWDRGLRWFSVGLS